MKVNSFNSFSAPKIIFFDFPLWKPRGRNGEREIEGLRGNFEGENEGNLVVSKSESYFIYN